MRFGLEAEKFLFNLRTQRPSEGVFSFIDGLSDFRGFKETAKITNEFVLNMVEIGTSPSDSVLEVLKDYLLHYLMIKKVAAREEVGLVPLASMPIDYLPHMASKWSYYVQNSILNGKKAESWMMTRTSPLRAAGNCAGVHVHAELLTPPEFHFSSRELADKFNMGLMMTPMIAFASSPYFWGEHEAKSMRALRYYYQTYRNFPLNGHLPPVMESSAEVLEYFKKSIDHWLHTGVSIGLEKEGLMSLIRAKGANWNPVRWNRAWNTIEIRCLDSDSVELDCAKFLWICSAMKRMDTEGEALKCSIIRSERELDEMMINDVLEVSGGSVSILPTHALQELFERAVVSGTEDELVHQYLTKLSEFAKRTISDEEQELFGILERVLDQNRTTADWMLSKTNGRVKISDEEATEFILESMYRQENVIKNIRSLAPEIFTKLDEMIPRYIGGRHV